MSVGLDEAFALFIWFQSTSSEEDVVSLTTAYADGMDPTFQSTSSEEDVVSTIEITYGTSSFSFNPRPPKRTLCPGGEIPLIWDISVSIHVLRRGRCVPIFIRYIRPILSSFNPRPPKRTLCRGSTRQATRTLFGFNPRPPKRTLCPTSAATLASVWSGFNPRPPKRTLCQVRISPRC